MRQPVSLNNACAYRILVYGIVQGVGFRPFIFNLAHECHLAGWVKNTSAGVVIEVEGNKELITSFIVRIQSEHPPLARIDQIDSLEIPLNGHQKFQILESEVIAEAFQPISPDVAICPDCLKELLDPNNRRYRYPFINCTNCGPRFTIIKDIPYDRSFTTMQAFPMCQSCQAEYENPLDRRFHAQPIACSDCGPSIWIENSDGLPYADGETALTAFRELINQGKIVAVKGLGGFHLACDALNSSAVQELRNRKLRVDKPFAIMMPDIGTVKKYFPLDQAEIDGLVSIERPVVLLDRPTGSRIAPETSPNLSTSGIMLAYTPLHVLLFNDKSGHPNVIDALVMTSGNLSEEPIAYDNSDARVRLREIADAFLMHNRPIHMRCDDSVIRIISDNNVKQKNPVRQYPIRRSRGYAPTPIRIPWKSIPILGCGAELKNTFCLSKDRYAFMSHHIGDLENFETFRSYEEAVGHFEKLFRITPELLVHDSHPDYLSTRYALDRSQNEGLPIYGIQHHHAHIAACMAENHLLNEQPVIGLAFDGTGYGEDGSIWGGEILVATYTNYQRYAHLKYIGLPGGDKAIKEPWRPALSWFNRLNIEWTEDLPPVKWMNDHGIPQAIMLKQIQNSIQCPNTSSMGRLFDAVAAILGIRNVVNYEAQGAIELEAIANQFNSDCYNFLIEDNLNGSFLIDPAPVILGVIQDLRRNILKGDISAKFHNAIVQLVVEISLMIRSESQINSVVLSGGVWQNMFLLYKTINSLQYRDFSVFWHQQVPTNDGGISLGQVAIAANRIRGK
jgi:hydrogenase maturation protein HypF